MRTSQDWWNNVLASEELLTDWLTKQYHGEATAANRIIYFRDLFCKNLQAAQLLTRIAHEEETHAAWVATLLRARGIEPVILPKEERYWQQTLVGIESFETGAAVAAHAEAMRLERIRVIVDDPKTPEDIRDVFAKILLQEIGHERMFAKLAGKTALAQTQGAHELGRQALGLIA